MDVFDCDVNPLKCINTPGHTHMVNRNRECNPQRLKNIIFECMVDRFCKLYSYLNVDPLHPNAIQVVLLMMGKSRQGQTNTLAFLEQMRIANIKLIPSSPSRILAM